MTVTYAVHLSLRPVPTALDHVLNYWMKESLYNFHFVSQRRSVSRIQEAIRSLSAHLLPRY